MSNTIEYIAIDTESTGFEPGSRVVELAAVRMDENGDVIDTFESLVNPGMPIPADASAVNGITDDMVADAPVFADVHAAFDNWWHDEATCGLQWALAHNAPFDGALLTWDSARAGLLMALESIVDTLAIARQTRKKANKLTELMVEFDIQVDGDAHRALHDAKACAAYFKARCLPCEDASALPYWNGLNKQHPYIAPGDLPATLQAIPDLVKSGGEFTFTYQDANGDFTERTITPYGWAMSQKHEVMFHGLCHLRGERRSFKANGIQS